MRQTAAVQAAVQWLGLSRCLSAPQDVQQLQPVAVGNQEHKTCAVQGQIHWVVDQLPLHHALLSAMIPDPAADKHGLDSRTTQQLHCSTSQQS